MAQDEFLILYSDIVHDDGAIDAAIADIKRLEKATIKSAENIKKARQNTKPHDVKGVSALEKQVRELLKAQALLKKQTEALNKVKKERKKLTDEELLQMQKEKLALANRRKEAKLQAIISTEQKNSIKAIRAQLSLTTLKWSKLTDAQSKNTTKGRLLVSQKLRLTKQIKKLEEATDDHRRSVGKYSKGLSKWGKTATRVFVGRTIVDGLRKIGQAMSFLIDANKDSNQSVKELDDALGDFTDAMILAGGKVLGFIAKPLTLLLNGITFIVDYFFKATDEMKRFSATSEALGGVVDGLNKELVKESTELAIVFNKLKNTTKGSKEHKAAIDQINKVYGKYLPNLLTEESTLEDIANAQRLANEALAKNTLLKIQNATIVDLVTQQVKIQTDAFTILSDIVKSTGGSVDGTSAQVQSLVSSLNDTGNAATRAFKALDSGDIFIFDQLNEEVRKTDSSMADFLASLQGLDGSIRTRIVNVVTNAANKTDEFSGALDLANETIDDLTGSMNTYDHSVQTNTSNLNKNTAAQKANSADRLAAIEAVQADLEKLEVENIEDKNARLISLEELRFEEEQTLRELQNDENKALLEGHEDELAALKKYNDGLAEEQEKTHQQNLLDIIQNSLDKEKALRDSRIKTIQVGANKEQKAADEFAKDRLITFQKEIQEEEKLLAKQRSKKLKTKAEEEAANKELFSNISKSAQKVGGLIVDLYKKSADLAGDRVKEQQGNLENAEQRQRDGLETNLAFERQQLAKKESEQLAAQKRAEDAAKILALFSMVAAYAQSGDEDALQNGLRDFFLLDILAGSLTGFEEGGYTGDMGTKQVAGFVHGREYVMTAEDTKKYGLVGKTGGEFGEAISDYFPTQTPTTINPYPAQEEAFKKAVQPQQNSNEGVISAVNKLSDQIAKQPNHSAQIVQAQKNMFMILTKIQKQNITEIKEEVLRPGR